MEVDPLRVAAQRAAHTLLDRSYRIAVENETARQAVTQAKFMLSDAQQATFKIQAGLTLAMFELCTVTIRQLDAAPEIVDRTKTEAFIAALASGISTFTAEMPPDLQREFIVRLVEQLIDANQFAAAEMKKMRHDPAN